MFTAPSFVVKPVSAPPNGFGTNEVLNDRTQLVSSLKMRSIEKEPHSVGSSSRYKCVSKITLTLCPPEWTPKPCFGWLVRFWITGALAL
jgi:hypothetical protein